MSSPAPRVTSFSEDSLREWFGQYDGDGTGLMDEAALAQLCEQLGVDPRSAPDIMRELDTNRDGKVGGWVRSLACLLQLTRKRLCCLSLGGADRAAVAWGGVLGWALVHGQALPGPPPSDHLRRCAVQIRLPPLWGGGGEW